ncbi:MTERF domain-containing protein 2 [Aphelenchoides bicaudatus]|nr:MTERF domain-containing protein 2 [Aphelenchoides bicaudatus]
MLRKLVLNVRVVRTYAKDLKFDTNERKVMRAAIELLPKAVSVTPGSTGQNVIIDKLWGSPKITKDGATIGNAVDLKDKYEILGANLILKNSDHYTKLIQTFINYCDFTLENSLRFLAEIADEIDVTKSQDIADRLNWFTGQGFISGSSLGRLVRKCPVLLYASDLGEIGLTFDKLAGFFPKKHLFRILTEAPHILLLPFDETELKYEYIYFHMGIEPEQLATSFGWIDMDLEEILMRHEFIKKTGRFYTPDPKKPQIEMRNPPVHRIFDTSDKCFAVEIAGTSEAEWLVFQQMYAKLKAMEDKDEPYEKIKRSVRKKFERRIKEAIQLDQDHYFTEYG